MTPEERIDGLKLLAALLPNQSDRIALHDRVDFAACTAARRGSAQATADGGALMIGQTKYPGPCPEHVYKHACKHCKAVRQRQKGGNRSQRQAAAPIYRELHWPAPRLA